MGLCNGCTCGSPGLKPCTHLLQTCVKAAAYLCFAPLFQHLSLKLLGGSMGAGVRASLVLSPGGGCGSLRWLHLWEPGPQPLQTPSPDFCEDSCIFISRPSVSKSFVEASGRVDLSWRSSFHGVKPRRRLWASAMAGCTCGSPGLKPCTHLLQTCVKAAAYFYFSPLFQNLSLMPLGGSI